VLLALALNKLGAVWVPINTDYRGAWLEESINDSRAAALVVDAAHLGSVQAIDNRLAHGHC